MSLLTPLTPRASAWLCGNVGEDATWVGDALFVEDRYWPDLVDGIISAGFTFERNELPN